MLDRAVEQLREKSPAYCDGHGTHRITVRHPELRRVGPKKTAWINFSETCLALQRCRESIMTFVVAEIAAEGSSLDGGGRLILKGRFLSKTIESVLKRYVRDYVQCGVCKSCHTDMVRDRALRVVQVVCGLCRSTRVVQGPGAIAIAAEHSLGVVDKALVEKGDDCNSLLPDGSPETVSESSGHTNIHFTSMDTQATINIGAIGHVAHGKSTIVRCMSGTKTAKFKKELVRDSTIQLGYASAKIYMGREGNDQMHCARKSCEKMDINFSTQWSLQRHISFVDCPGHELFMSTMISGAAVMDAVLLVIAADAACPQPQTAEHLAAIEILGLQHVIIVQTKIDLVTPERARENLQKILDFVRGTCAENAPVVPVAANWNVNLDLLSSMIVQCVPLPHRDIAVPPLMSVIRSFDVNKPGASVTSLKGAVVGGSLTRGSLKVGDEVELRPGAILRDKDGHITHVQPYLSKVVSLRTDETALESAVPGGLVGVGTTLDPTLSRGNGLVGQVMGLRGSVPDVYSALTVRYRRLRTLVGVGSSSAECGKPVNAVVKKDLLLVSVGSTATRASVMKIKEKENGDRLAYLKLVNPVCCNIGDRISFSRLVGGHWRLSGWAEILKGEKVETLYTPVQHQEPLKLL